MPLAAVVLIRVWRAAKLSFNFGLLGVVGVISPVPVPPGSPAAAAGTDSSGRNPVSGSTPMLPNATAAAVISDNIRFFKFFISSSFLYLADPGGFFDSFRAAVHAELFVYLVGISAFSQKLHEFIHIIIS